MQNFSLPIFQEITECISERVLYRLQGLSRVWYAHHIPLFYELRSKSQAKPLAKFQKHMFRLILHQCHLSSELFYHQKDTHVSLNEPNAADYSVSIEQNERSIYWVHERPQWELYLAENGHWYHISNKLPCISVQRTRQKSVEDLCKLIKLLRPNRFKINLYRQLMWEMDQSTHNHWRDYLISVWKTYSKRYPYVRRQDADLYKANAEWTNDYHRAQLRILVKSQEGQRCLCDGGVCWYPKRYKQPKEPTDEMLLWEG